MNITTPVIEERQAQPYLGIRVQVTMQEMGSGIIPELNGEILNWLQQQGATPTGAPFLRYHVINMAEKLDIEACWPVASAFSGNERIHASELPAGHYASLIYTGLNNGIQGNKILLDWGTEQGLAWDQWTVQNGDAFGSRYETYLTNPADEPDPSRWQVEVAILLADHQAHW